MHCVDGAAVSYRILQQQLIAYNAALAPSLALGNDLKGNCPSPYLAAIVLASST